MENSLFTKIGLLILRIGTSLLMLTHGIPKIEMLLNGNSALFPNPIGLGSTLSLILVIGAEVFCSCLLIIGFKSRLFALPLIFNMWVAGFIAHHGESFQNKELAILYFIIYITIAFLGSGDISFDSFLKKQKEKRKSTPYQL